MSYEASVAGFCNRARTAIGRAVVTLAKDAHQRIVQSTPIDTGRAMSSWNIAPGTNPDLSVTPLLADKVNIVTGAIIESPAAGASPLTRSQAETAAYGQQQALAAAENAVTISNNLDYIRSLEAGRSQQAAAGEMFNNNVLITKQRAKAHLDAAAKEAFSA